MTQLTDAATVLGLIRDDSIFKRQSEGSIPKPVELRASNVTTVWHRDLADDATLSGSGAPQRAFAAPNISAVVQRMVSADSSPLQIREGTVLEVDRQAGTMQALLDAKIGEMPRHTGEIDLEWVTEQDQDLVRPGAIFYLTLFKRTKPSVENAQELRFRRRPSWSATQLDQVERDAAVLRPKMKAPRTAA